MAVQFYAQLKSSLNLM